MAKAKTNLILGPALIVLSYILMIIIAGGNISTASIPVILSIVALVLFFINNEKIGLILSLISGILVVIFAITDGFFELIISFFKNLEHLNGEIVLLVVLLIAYVVGGVFSIISGLKVIKK